jgi:hypothetical protein
MSQFSALIIILPETISILSKYFLQYRSIHNFLGGSVYSSEEFIQCSLRVAFGDSNKCPTQKVGEARTLSAIVDNLTARTGGATSARTLTVAKQQVQVVPTSDDFPAIDPTRPKKKK